MSQKQEILLIEDDNEVAAWIKKRLNALENIALIRHAKTITEATNLLDKFRFGAIILDLNLPDGYGVDIIKRIRRRESETLIYVFSMSRELKNVCLRLGATAFFYKGTEGDDLIETLSRN